MSSPRVIIVTGANRGIGRAICQTILSQPDLKPLRLIAASRSGEDLAFDKGKDAKHEVLYRKLDISDPENVYSFADTVVKDVGGDNVDILINNAGVNLFDDSNPENVKRTFDVNFRGTREMCLTFIPHMRKQNDNSDTSSSAARDHQPRIVNLSSIASSLKFYSPALQQRFRNPELSLRELEEIAQEYQNAVSSSSHALETSGFGLAVRSYGVSKALVTGMTRALARENPDIAINCCCPGWVATDMGKGVGRAPKTEEEGARIPVHLALDGSVEGVSGVYWANEGVRSREVGKVIEW